MTRAMTRTIFVLGMVTLLTACGGGNAPTGVGVNLGTGLGIGQGSGTGGAGGGGGGAAVTQVQGVAMFGALQGASVDVYAITASGGRGAHVAGPYTTDNAGRWTMPMLSGNGPWLVTVTGGSYRDEATGKTVNMAGIVAEGVLVPGQASVAISPFSQAMVDAMRHLVTKGFTVAQALGKARDRFMHALWMDPALDQPVDPYSIVSAGTTPDLVHGALLAGMSVVAASPAMTSFVATNPAEVQIALAQDLADLTLDGLIFGQPVKANTPNGPISLPAIGNGALSGAASQFVQNRTGQSLAASAPGWQIYPITWPASPPALGSLTFSGTAMQVMALRTFVPEKVTVSTSGNSYTWDSASAVPSVSLMVGTGGLMPLVYLTVEKGHSFYGTKMAWSIYGSTPGVTVDPVARTVTFNNTTLNGQGFGAYANTSIVLNGTLRY